MRRLTLILSALLAAAGLSGCERLCTSTEWTWCTEEGYALNSPPYAAFAFSPSPTPREDTVEAGRTVTFRSTSEDPQRDPLYLEWDLDGDGEFELEGYEKTLDGLPLLREVEGVFPEPGTYRVTLRVSDFPQFRGAPGEATLTKVLHVVDPAANRRPRAVVTASPARVSVGQEVVLNAGGSDDPDFYDAPLEFRWHFPDGFVASDSFGPEARGHFLTTGTRDVKVEVEDAFGAEDEAEVEVEVVAGPPPPPPEPNTPPAAYFTAVPISPQVGEPVLLDASDSTDPEGPIARFEWDLDADGAFELDRGPYPSTTVSFTSPGERYARVRVTDARGASATFGRTIVVRAPSLGVLARTAAAPAPQAGRLPFAARVAGRPVRGARGALGRGRVRARVLGPPSRARRALKRFLRARWRVRLTRVSNRRVTALALARAGRARACLRIRLAAHPGRPATGRVKLLGGTRAARRLRGGARFRFGLEPDGSATALGSLTARRGARRGLPRACKRLR
jgi:hypothetical protein